MWHTCMLACTCHVPPRALSLDPAEDIFISLATLLHNTGRLEEAGHTFRRALRHHPNSTDLICGMVCVLT